MTTRALLNAQEVADLTGFHPKTLYHWARTGYLPSRRFNRSIRFDHAEVTAWLAKRKRAAS